MKQELTERYRRLFPADLKEAAAICKERWKEDCAHILQVADEVCRNRFIFDLKCDMEKTAQAVDFGDGPVQWDYMPGDDVEFIYQFNRHRYFICLGQAYQMTGDETYARHFVRLLTDWINTQKLSEETKNTTWRVREAGFRGEVWVKAMAYFLDSPQVTEEVVQDFLDCLKEQGKWIVQMDSPYRYISNWGVIENHGLFEIGLILPDREAGDAMLCHALSRL